MADESHDNSGTPSKTAGEVTFTPEQQERINAIVAEHVNKANEGKQKAIDDAVAEAVAASPFSVKDALALYIMQHIGLSSVSGIRSIDMVRKVADGDGDDSATETARYGIIGLQTALDTHKPLKTPPSLINALSNG